MVCLIVVGLAAIWWNARPDPEPRFCTMGLAFVVIDGKQVVLEDQGSGGRDGCDHADWLSDPHELSDSGLDVDGVLGFDCKVRDVDGTVVATTQPNRSDGSCGQPGR
jgi:hypothetical protein